MNVDEMSVEELKAFYVEKSKSVWTKIKEGFIEHKREFFATGLGLAVGSILTALFGNKHRTTGRYPGIPGMRWGNGDDELDDDDSYEEPEYETPSQEDVE